MKNEHFLDLPDDYCEACCKNPASVECAHGLLCKSCADEVHGKGKQCQEHESHDGMCNMNNPICKAYMDKRIAEGKV